MNIYLFSNMVLNQNADVYGYAIRDIIDSSESVKTCFDYLTDSGNQAGNIEIHTASSTQELMLLNGVNDIVVSLQTVLYEKKEGSGLRGFYRSTRHPNYERCKGLAITILKSMKDHSDLYYHGVFNELRDRHPDPAPYVNVKPVAALIEVGYDASDRQRHHRLKGIALARGILRHLNADRSSYARTAADLTSSSVESATR